MTRMELGYLRGQVSEEQLQDLYDANGGAGLTFAPVPPIFQGGKWALKAARVWWATRALRGLAQGVATRTGGVVRALEKGFEVIVPHGKRGIVVRIMREGGGRTNYYRVSIPGKETFTREGVASVDQSLTHIDITDTSLDDIVRLIERIKGGL